MSKENNWRSIYDDPPTKSQKVLVLYYEKDFNYANSAEDKEFIWTCKGEVIVDRYRRLFWSWEDPFIYNKGVPSVELTDEYFYCLTHWMPLPEGDHEDIRSVAGKIIKEYLE